MSFETPRTKWTTTKKLATVMAVVGAVALVSEGPVSMALSGLIWYGLVTLIGKIVSRLRRSDVNVGTGHQQRDRTTRTGTIGAIKERSARGLFARLERKSVPAQIALEIVAANYPGPGREPLRPPLIATGEINGLTSSFLDRGLISCDALFVQVWGVTSAEYFQVDIDLSVKFVPNEPAAQTGPSSHDMPSPDGLATDGPQPGWYGDPFARFRYRYWDAGWTSQVSSNDRIYEDNPD